MIHERPLPYPLQATQVLECLRPLGEPCLLDSCYPRSLRSFSRYDIISAAPQKLLQLDQNGAQVREMGLWSSLSTDPFDYLESILNPLDTSSSLLPFTGGLIGCWSYDAGRILERMPTQARDEIDFPWISIGLYLWAIVIDHEAKASYLVAQPQCAELLLKQIERLVCRLDPDEQSNAVEGTANQAHFELTTDWQANQTEAQYQRALEQIAEYIRAGDCYQVNYAQRFAAHYQGDPWFAYCALREAASTPFAAFLEYAQGTVLSLSPERFLQVTGDGAVETRPIKGTRPRRADPILDQQEAEDLMRSEKDRSENLMIVDLLRNDLSRTCVPGTVRVPELFKWEPYPNVHHLVSSVTGQLADTETPLSLLKNAFPGGSITGAPKIRAMEIIEELEPDRRSVYCGAIGYISASGQMDTNISIRTLLSTQNQIYCWAGGGIVAESESDAEYQETFNKVNNLLNVLKPIKD